MVLFDVVDDLIGIGKGFFCYRKRFDRVESRLFPGSGVQDRGVGQTLVLVRVGTHTAAKLLIRLWPLNGVADSVSDGADVLEFQLLLESLLEVPELRDLVQQTFPGLVLADGAVELEFEVVV